MWGDTKRAGAHLRVQGADVKARCAPQEAQLALDFGDGVPALWSGVGWGGGDAEMNG